LRVYADQAPAVALRIACIQELLGQGSVLQAADLAKRQLAPCSWSEL